MEQIKPTTDSGRHSNSKISKQHGSEGEHSWKWLFEPEGREASEERPAGHAHAAAHHEADLHAVEARGGPRVRPITSYRRHSAIFVCCAFALGSLVFDGRSSFFCCDGAHVLLMRGRKQRTCGHVFAQFFL